MKGKFLMKILFVGNSHTFFNDMVYMFKKLAESKNIYTDIVMITKGGEFLKNHINAQHVKFNIKYGEYDLIVLQENESEFPGMEIYSQSINDFITFADKKQKFILYQNFAKKGQFERQEELAQICEEVGKKYSIPIAKVGRVFYKLQKEYPELILYHTDNAHASPLGSYIIALTLIRTIFGVSVKNLPNIIEYKNEKLVEVEISLSQNLQDIVDTIIDI